MVLGKLPVPGRPTILITVGQGPIALAVGAGGVVWTFLLSSILFLLSPSFWEMARYRLKYCLKGPLNPKQPNNHLCTRLSKSFFSKAYYILAKNYLRVRICSPCCHILHFRRTGIVFVIL